MPTKRISKDLNDGIYFLTLTVRRWYYLFDRYGRWQILVDSLNYSREHKQLKIYHYVLMLNHLHLLAEAPDMVGFVRDFKRHTTSELQDNLAATEPNVRQLFEQDSQYRIWRKSNLPLKVESERFYQQKAQYIEENPVRKGYVRESAHWVYSSANPDSPVLVDSLL